LNSQTSVLPPRVLEHPDYAKFAQVCTKCRKDGKTTKIASAGHAGLCEHHQMELAQVIQTDVYDRFPKRGFNNVAQLGPELIENGAKSYHEFIYDHLLPSIDNCLINHPDDGNNFSKTEKLNKTVGQVAETRNHVLLILKGCILEYRLYLNPLPTWIQAIVDTVTFVLQSSWTAMQAALDMLAHVIKVLVFSVGIVMLTIIDLFITNAGIITIALGGIMAVVGAILIPVGGVGMIVGGAALIVGGAGVATAGALEFRRHTIHGDSDFLYNSRLSVQGARAWLEAQL